MSSAQDAGAAIERVEFLTGRDLFDYQALALHAAATLPAATARLCLYYRTGAGKSITSMALALQWGVQRVVVVAPPITHPEWVALGRQFNIEVEPMSHAKFRMKNTKLSRDTMIIADEFHLFGGHSGAGWKKLRTLSRGLRAPLVLASATPNYNDAERCYCIATLLHPDKFKGGFIEFIYQYCNTVPNPFGLTPLVDDDRPFRNHKDAVDFLASMDNVLYVEDNVQFTINEITYDPKLPDSLIKYGLHPNGSRIVASKMEERHLHRTAGLITPSGLLNQEVKAELGVRLSEGKRMIIFCNHATVAKAVAMQLQGIWPELAVVALTGDHSTRTKEHIATRFRNRDIDVLVGTSTLATGTDGFDKVCDRLVILDDTDDDALRRQLIGRIMPRGLDVDASNKKVYRFNPMS